MCIRDRHSQASHAPSNAERNVIAGIQVNAKDLTPDGSRKVNITVPTGKLASKDTVAESDLTPELQEKVNAASEGNHGHINKEVLDQLELSLIHIYVFHFIEIGNLNLLDHFGLPLFQSA